MNHVAICISFAASTSLVSGLIQCSHIAVCLYTNVLSPVTVEYQSVINPRPSSHVFRVSKGLVFGPISPVIALMSTEIS